LRRRVRCGGETYRGTYEPLIAETLFHAVQAVLHDRTPPRGKQHTFNYTGLPLRHLPRPAHG